LPFTGERVLAGKGGALRIVFSDGGCSDTATPDLQKLFYGRNCSLVDAVFLLQSRRPHRKEAFVSQKVF